MLMRSLIVNDMWYKCIFNTQAIVALYRNRKPLKQNEVSLSSPVTVRSRLPIVFINETAEEHGGPIVSNATGANE